MAETGTEAMTMWNARASNTAVISRESGDPLRRGLSHDRLWNTGSPAFAGDDGGGDGSIVPFLTVHPAQRPSISSSPVFPGTPAQRAAPPSPPHAPAPPRP